MSIGTKTGITRGITSGIIGLLIMAMTGCLTSTQDEKEKTPAANLSYSKDLAVSPDKFWHDKELEKSFSAYWGLRGVKKAAELFKTEAPYFQTTANFDRYRALVENLNGQIIGIELIERTDVTARLVRFRCVLHLRGSNGDKKIPLLEQWVLAGDKWYHVWRDPLLFPNES